MSKNGTFEEYFSEDIGGEKVETDLIEYSVNGIEKWSIWSSVHVDWIEVSLFSLKAKWPGKFEQIEEKLINKAQDIIANHSEEYEPEMERA